MAYKLTKRELALKRSGFGQHSKYWNWYRAQMNHALKPWGTREMFLKRQHQAYDEWHRQTRTA